MTEQFERQLRRRMFFWRMVLQYGAAVIVLVFYVTVSLHFSHTPDDTYVYLQYGRNIARGEGMAFNAGAASSGITGPLWAMLIAGGVKLSLDPYIVAKTLDVVIASLALLAVMAFAYVVIRDRLYAIIAAWIFSFDAWYLRWAGSGTEMSLAVLLAMLALWYAHKKEHITSSFVSALLTLVRPEGMLLFLATQIDAAVNNPSRMSALRVAVGSVILYVMVLGTWLGFTYTAFGAILPHQLQNLQFNGLVWTTAARDLWTGLKILGTTQLVLVLSLVVGLLVTVRKFGWHILREDGFPLLWVLAVPLWFALFHVEVGSRQLLLILPVIVVYGLWGVKRIEIAELVSPRRALTMLLLVAGIALAQNQLVYRLLVVPQMNNLELGVAECLKPIAYWLRTNTPAGTTILAPEAGVIGYVSERTVYDASGTVTPDMRSAFAADGYDTGMVEKRYESVLRPEYVVDRSPLPERLTSETMKPIMTRTFPGLGLTRPQLTYYTLYKVMR